MPLNIQPPGPRFSLRSTLLVAALMLGALAAPRAAQADDPLGLYIGAAYGQGYIRADLSGLAPSGDSPLGEFNGSHSAYQGMLGIRPLPFLGAEITYMDFGQVSFGTYSAGGVVSGGPYPALVQISQKGEAAFALLYLPVPIIDVYVKAGMSRITTDMSATYGSTTGVEVVSRSPTDTAFAYGAGVQWKLGEWAVRGEYERFSAAGANPSLVSIGMTYWIPLD
jgi:opacity protein-like surface antigen